MDRPTLLVSFESRKSRRELFDNGRLMFQYVIALFLSLNTVYAIGQCSNGVTGKRIESIQIFREKTSLWRCLTTIPPKLNNQKGYMLVDFENGQGLEKLSSEDRKLTILGKCGRFSGRKLRHLPANCRIQVKRKQSLQNPQEVECYCDRNGCKDHSWKEFESCIPLSLKGKDIPPSCLKNAIYKHYQSDTTRLGRHECLSMFTKISTSLGAILLLKTCRYLNLLGRLSLRRQLLEQQRRFHGLQREAEELLRDVSGMGPPVGNTELHPRGRISCLRSSPWMTAMRHQRQN